MTLEVFEGHIFHQKSTFSLIYFRLKSKLIQTLYKSQHYEELRHKCFIKSSVILKVIKGKIFPLQESYMSKKFKCK